jgi:2-oxoglutarate ferredoxin oxidoreductase subunit alpha
MAGNEACGEGAVRAGCRFYSGYPITPQNELTACMAQRMDETGGTFIQAESELSAINMVFGASVAGARAMTSSSSPGISLKQEGISYLAGCELPAVIVNVMRGGPGLGNISGAQGDYFQAVKGGGHGDYHVMVLAPSSVQEMFDFTFDAFALADRYRIPVMVLADGVLGQTMEPLEYDSEIQPSGLVPKPWALTGAKGRASQCIKSLVLPEGALEEHNKKLQEKYREIEARETRFEAFQTEDAEIVLVAYGTPARLARNAASHLRASGSKVGLLRPKTLWPFPHAELRSLSEAGRKFLVVEMSAGQMLEDVRLAVQDDSRVFFHGRMGGGMPAEEDVVEAVRRIQGGKKE